MPIQNINQFSFDNDDALSGEVEDLEEKGTFFLNKAAALKILQSLNKIIQDKHTDYRYEGPRSNAPKVDYALETAYNFVCNLFGPEECIETTENWNRGDWLSGKGYSEWTNNAIFFTIGTGTLVKLNFNPKDKKCVITYILPSEDITLKVFEDKQRIQFYVGDYPLYSSSIELKNPGTLTQNEDDKSLGNVLMPVSLEELLSRVEHIQPPQQEKHK